LARGADHFISKAASKGSTIATIVAAGLLTAND
jgi:hypothetical protein